MKNNKFFRFLLILGLFVIIMTPIIASLAETVKLVDKEEAIVSQESSLSIQNVDAYPITLAQNQKVSIKFSVQAEFVEASLKILGKGLYDAEFQKNTTYRPLNVTGQYFLVSKPTWAADPSAYEDTLNVVTANQDDFFFIEFMGGGQAVNDIIWSEPGDYMVVVYGNNTFINSTDVAYSIEIFRDGPAEIITAVGNWIGWGLILLVGLSVGIRAIKQLRRAS